MNARTCRQTRFLSISMVALTLVGCGELGAPGDDPAAADGIGVVTSALVTSDFGVNTPFVKVEGDPNSIWPAGGGGGMQKFVALRRGYGASPNALDNAAIPKSSSWYKNATSSGLDTLQTSTRPLFWLNEKNFRWSEVYADAGGSGEVLDDSPGTPVDTFSVATSMGRKVQGPPSPLTSHVTGDFQTVYALFSGNHIHKGYMNSTTSWSDFQLPIGNDAPTPVPANVPTSSPQALNRSYFGNGNSDNSDSIWFGCGAATPARACEYRFGGAGNNQTFSASFGSGTSFLAKTRPVAFADVTRSAAHERWVFGAISKSDGVHSIFGLRETSDIVSGSQPTYTSKEIVKGTSTTAFSSPMPFMYQNPETGNLMLAVVYFRTDGGTTKIMESSSSAFPYTSWTTKQLLDTGVAIPAGSEPVPTVSTVEPAHPMVNSIIFRRPSGSVLQTAEIRQEQTAPFAYVQTFLPSSTDETNLYVMQDNGTSLYKVDETNGASPPTLGTAVWSGVTAFTSDNGRGLAYATQGGKLWEVNLNDGSRRQLGSENWAGTTKLAWGFDGNWPALWAIRSNTLRKVDLSTGTSTLLWGHFTSQPPYDFYKDVGAMAMMVSPGLSDVTKSKLFVVLAGSRATSSDAQTLYSVDIDSGVPTQLGTAGDWANATAMTANAADGRLYIADGADSSHYRIFRVDATNGNWLHGYSGYFSNPQFMTTINGVPYLMKSQVIYRLSSSGDTHTQNVKLNGISSGSWGYTVTGMVGRDYHLSF